MATKQVKDDSMQVPASTVSMNNATVTGDNDALSGHFVTVATGKHAGRYGVLERITSVSGDGRPNDCVVLTRDDDHAYLDVKYADLRRAEPGAR